MLSTIFNTAAYAKDGAIILVWEGMGDPRTSCCWTTQEKVGA